MSTDRLSNWSAATPAEIMHRKRMDRGDIVEPNQEAIRAHFEKVKETPVVNIHEDVPLTEQEVSNNLYIRAQMLMYVQKRKVLPYVVDEHNSGIVRALKLYAMNDKRFESEGHGDLSKGLVLAGLQGCGKSMLLKMFADAGPVATRKFVHKPGTVADIKRHGWGDGMRLGLYHLNDIHSCVGLEHDYRQKDGQEKINQIRKSMRPLVFDDLGFEESSAMNYGNKINVMEQIIQHRYNLNQDYGIKTYFSTNLVNGDELEKIYGVRVRSRMREMCNWFYFDVDNHIDRRK